ncbi:MAG: lipopolysaccharide cholinephosphotransferase [Oscillospiraceae bacterium]|jgi:lipopolysaccharide cholinephosphotransferase|nr:lipopolysaccharide cholinephosphotransferase [Oscillospiraceae bacterium]
MELNRDEELQRIKETELEILEKIHYLCEKHHLRYYLLGGTLLGAVRHKGFIPWDDDIDIGIPRKDYEKFLEIAQKELPDFLTVQAPGIVKPYPYFFAKVVNNRTTLVEDVVKHLGITTGVYVDIFPLDGFPSDQRTLKAHYKRFKLQDKIRNFWIRDPHTKTSIKRVLATLIHNFVNLEKLQIRNQKLLSKYDFDTSELVGNCVGAWGKKEIVPKEFIGEPKLYEFENKRFYGVEDSDNYLKRIYGDYMELPPPEKRKSHHRYTIKFDM